MKAVLLLLTLLYFPSFLSAQVQEETYEEEEYVDYEDTEDFIFQPKFSASLFFDVGIPLTDFRDNLNRVAFGGSGSFLVRTNPKSTMPIMMGLSGGLLTYDSESQDQIIIIDGFSTNAQLTTRNNIFIGHAVIRILPPVNFSIQPYFDGLFGFKNLYTRTTLEDLDAIEDDTIESYIEQGDWALSVGGALGCQVLIGGHESLYVLVDARCGFYWGQAADYLVRIDDPNIQIIDTIDAFEEKNSITDMLIPQIGLSFVF